MRSIEAEKRSPRLDFMAASRIPAPLQTFLSPPANMHFVCTWVAAMSDPLSGSQIDQSKTEDCAGSTWRNGNSKYGLQTEVELRMSWLNPSLADSLAWLGLS